MEEKYQLRYAAGIYWLLDMQQEGPYYRKPVPMNEGGAYIWNKMQSGKDREQIVESMCDIYGIDKKEAEEDVRRFIEQLEKHGIVATECKTV